jgi:hypothetical protein
MSDNKFVLVPDIDWLANVIRTVDGSNKLGAGALAEKIVEALAAMQCEKLPQAAPMPDERQFILQVLLCVLQNDVEALQVMHHERSEELSVAYAALSAAPVSEHTQEASTAQQDKQSQVAQAFSLLNEADIELQRLGLTWDSAATPCGQVSYGPGDVHTCATPRIGSEKLCPDCNPRKP